jgi:hypothetical protein
MFTFKSNSYCKWWSNNEPFNWRFY